MIVDGIKGSDKISMELDRARAIKNAINELSEGDILLIAGKGHEKKQIIGSKNHEIFFLSLIPINKIKVAIKEKI